MPENQRPYISFVIAGRNDNYGGDFNDRLQNSFNLLAAQLEEYQLDSEFILVNYNPMRKKPPLFESIEWPKDRRQCKIRIITVPEQIHKTYENPTVRLTAPLYEFIAKNTGIRRAKGWYICATNPDLVYDPFLIRFLSKKILEEEKYYRANCCNYKKIELDGTNLPSDLIKEIQKNSFEIHLKGMSYPVDFSTENFRLGYEILKIKNQHNLLKKTGKTETLPDNFYHNSSSGNFMLMHSNKWHQLKAYPEDTLISAYTDALMVVIAESSGMEEVLFDWPVFLQDHSRQNNPDDDVTNKNIQTMNSRFIKEGKEMLRKKKPIIRNDENWGLKGVELEEIEF